MEILLPNRLLLSKALECYLRVWFAWMKQDYIYRTSEENSNPDHARRKTDGQLHLTLSRMRLFKLCWATVASPASPSRPAPLGKQQFLQFTTLGPPGIRVWADTPLFETQPSPTERCKSIQHEYFTELKVIF